MNFKKLFFSLAMCAILTLPLSAAVHADESYPVLEVAEQGCLYIAEFARVYDIL